MLDMSKTIIPKSDQLNADDLISGPRTVRITDVRGSDNPDQPIAVHFEGDDGRPYKPCKSMRRVMVHVWGEDGHAFVGKSMTLYTDPNVAFGGIKVGGIRISHVSGIDREMAIPLMVTRGQRKPYPVKPLRQDQGRDRRPPPQDDGFPGDRQPQSQQQQTQQTQASGITVAQRCAQFDKRVAEATTTTKLKAIFQAAADLRRDAERMDPERWSESQIAYHERFDTVEKLEREHAHEDARG
jgi:hypothetical protein